MRKGNALRDSNHYDFVIVGGGVGGLTLALLAGLNGHRVLLLEKSPALGGSLRRFKRNGISLDTGFHFTGGLTQSGILTQMLRVLGMDGDIIADPITREEDNRFILEAAGRVLSLPVGFEPMVNSLKRQFPREQVAIDTYFRLIREVNGNTASLDLNTITELTAADPFDSTSLKDVLDSLTDDRDLKCVLCGYSMCYGVPNHEMSFANHARVVFNMYERVARVQRGGDAFLDAFIRQLKTVNVTVRPRTHITECRDVENRRVGRFVLNTGETVTTDHCVFTIHPRAVLETVSRANVSKAFAARVENFEPSNGFFTLYAEVDDTPEIPPFQPAIISLFPIGEADNLFTKHPDQRPLVIMKSRELDQTGRPRNVLNAFELSHVDDVAAWTKTRLGDRPADYQAYKRRRVEHMTTRILTWYPEYRNHFHLLDSASMLTFRDYLHSPYGCAYGIKQKMGQFNVFGRLPLKNVFAAGQNAALPGLVGTMLASFVIGRGLLGKDAFKAFISRRLKHTDPT
ncbi:MAG: NAD(P)-binding protein [Lentisphaeria bacterium]|nr:NAD(P)-binding protein [Lentisphaeria bacterium]